jgi:hypothetical protein
MHRTGKGKKSSSYQTAARKTTGSALPSITKVSEHSIIIFYHENNMLFVGKTRQLGKVVFDVTDLKEQHVKAHKEKGYSTRSLKIRVEVLLQIEIIGRDLKFFVRWPATREGKLHLEVRSP